MPWPPTFNSLQLCLMSEQRRDTFQNLNLFKECQYGLEETQRGQRECVCLWKHPVLCVLCLYRWTASDRDRNTLLTCAPSPARLFLYASCTSPGLNPHTYSTAVRSSLITQPVLCKSLQFTVRMTIHWKGFTTLQPIIKMQKDENISLLFHWACM